MMTYVLSFNTFADEEHDTESLRTNIIVELDNLFKEIVSLFSRVMLNQLRKDFLAEGESRRNNMILVYGIDERADECTNTIIVKLAHDMDVEISEQELSVSH